MGIINLSVRSFEKAFSEEQFKSWSPSEQRQWVKDHPDSKFARDYHESNPSAKPKKEKVSPDEKKAKADEAFKQMVATKTDLDKKAFITARANGVAIPPAWNNVTYNEKPVNGVIAEGTDAKGRKQRLEDPEYRQSKIREKHQRIREKLEPEFDGMIKKLRKEIDTPEHQCLYLITQTAFRIGGEGDGKAEAKAYGASTLLGKHVSVNGNEVTFDFIGKEGVRQIHKVRDPIIAKFVAGKGADEKLFDTSDSKIRSAWKKLGGEKVHDIRSVLATRIAKSRLKDLIPPPPKTEKELSSIIKNISESASKTLGNRPSEALNTYIDQSILPKVSA